MIGILTMALVGAAVYGGLALLRGRQVEAVVIPPDGLISGAGPMPGWLQAADPSIQKEFVWAAAHKQELQYVPCYCGCMAQGHTSNADCYYDFDTAGNITQYDSHAFGCGTCLDITREVRQGLARGKSLTQIRQEIDKKYQAQGMQPTQTPMPPAQ
ncbi:MAG TPA: PCYCGC motif-containing (lipo)protein [Symbiobacteriaceae bacterium]